MELKDTKCSGCNTLRKKTDFIYKEKVNKTCCICLEYRMKNKEKNKEKNKDKIKEKQKQYYEQNKEKKKQYYEQNKEQIVDKKKKFYAKNTEKIKEKVQKYAIQNKDKIKETNKKYQDNNPLMVKVRNMISSSIKTDKKNNRIYEETDYVDYDFLLGLWETQTGLCGYEQCKCEMVLTFNLETKNPQQITIQRLDNDIAHVKSNVILSCYECNVIKRMETKL